MPRNRGRNARNRSPGKHAGRVPGEAAGRRRRDSGVDVQSASACLPVALTGSRAQGPEASVWSSNNEVLQAVETQVDSPPLTDESSDSNSSLCSLTPLLKPYDGRPDQRVFDLWVLRVESWAIRNNLRSRDVMANFPELLTGRALQLYQREVFPTLHSKKWKPKKVFKLLQKECFPFDHKVILCSQLMSTKQGNRSASAFAGDLNFLARHLPHVSGEFLALVFWAGLNHRVASLLVLEGIEPGDLDLDTLEKHASKYDRVVHYFSTNRRRK